MLYIGFLEKILQDSLPVRIRGDAPQRFQIVADTFRPVCRIGNPFFTGLTRLVAGHAAGMTGAGGVNVAVLMSLRFKDYTSMPMTV